MAENNLIKVLVADDHKLFRAGIIKMLSDYPDISIIEEAENGDEVYEKYFKVKPDVTLVDISMPVISGIEALKRIRKEDKSAKILFLSMYDTEEFIYSCLISGGMGLINKNIMEDELVHAIRCVYSGKRYFGKNVDDTALSNIILKYEAVYSTDSNIILPGFTSREIEVLEFISKGYTSSDIAKELFISMKTVDSHRTHMARKLKLKSVSELPRFAVEYFSKEQN